MSLNGIKDQFNELTDQLQKAMWGRSLIEAAYEGDLQQIRKALDNGADINFQSTEDASDFANYTHIDGLCYYVQGARVFSTHVLDESAHPCGHGNTALMRAVFYNNEESVTLLLEKGAMIGVQNSVGQDALYIARMTENARMQDILLDEIGRRGTSLSQPLTVGHPLKFKKKTDDPNAP